MGVFLFKGRDLKIKIRIFFIELSLNILYPGSSLVGTIKVLRFNLSIAV